MDIVANLLAGLGLFFVGIKGLGFHMKQMTGRRFRVWVDWATGNRLASAAVGAAAGMVTQSINAVTFITLSLVTGGMLDMHRALLMVAWANMGPALMVFVATMDIHMVTLYLLGLVGVSHYLGLNDDDRYRNGVGALFGVGMLLLGLWLIKQGAAPLKDLDWVIAMTRASADSWTLLFVAGCALTVVVQSSSTVSVIAVTMASTGLLGFEQVLMIVLGSGLGSGLSTVLLANNLPGTGRQLALIQLLVKTMGVFVLLAWLLLEAKAGIPGLRGWAETSGYTLASSIAIVYLLMQVISAVLASVFADALERVARRWSPPHPVEALSKPVYLYAQAADEAETALDLVEREQARLAGLLPRHFDDIRPEEIDAPLCAPGDLIPAMRAVATECQRFIDRLLGQSQAHDTLERLVNVRARNELLIQLHDGCADLSKLLVPAFEEPEAISQRHSIVEGLCSVLMVLDDVLARGGPEDRELLLTLTSDRSSVMRSIRERLVRTTTPLSADSLSRLLPAASLLERMVWLTNRYAQLL